MKAIINARIYDFENYIDNGYVIYDKHIQKVGKMSDFINKNYEIVDAKKALLIPGLVLSHTHIYSAFARGLALPCNAKNFQEILDQMWWKIDHYIDNKITYSSGASIAYECMLNGITTIIDHHASGKEIIGSLDALKHSVVDLAKLRGIFAFELSDRFNVDKAITENIDFIKNNKNEHVAGLFGMHASMSLSNKTLKKVENCLGNSPIHIHVAESEMDQEDAHKRYNMRIINRLNSFHLINENSLIVHGVYLSDEEISIIKNKKAYIVINPTSNMNNAVGITDVKRFVDNGLKVLVGNDGLSSTITNEYLNALYVTHLKNNDYCALGLGEILQMINNSYEYVSKMLDVKLGRIKSNYLSDFLLVPYTPITPIDEGNVFGHIFFGLFPSFKPKDVFVDGERIVKDYKATNKELLKEVKKAPKVAARLWKRVKGD